MQTAPVSTAAGAQELAKSETGTARERTAAGPKLRRRSRRQLHGEVTITRPNDTGPVPTPAPDVLAEWVPSEAPARLEVVGAQDPRLLVPQAPEDGDSWPRYPALVRKLRALRAEAEEARQRERREALAWIVKAIADYDLSPSELGLR